jgi:hypothetical protein
MSAREINPCARDPAIDHDNNFVRMHKTLRMAPAMATGGSDRLWSIEEIVALINARAEKPKRPNG